MGATDEVRLAVPARPELLRLVRVTAAGLASRLGFSYDEVEDLRLAIDELCYGLTGPEGRDGTVHITYRMSPERLDIEGDGHFDGPVPVIALTQWSEIMLTALVDEHELQADDFGARFRLVKRAEKAHGAVLNGRSPDGAQTGRSPDAPEASP